MEVKISNDFTVEDIHKIREANYEKTKNMSNAELVEYYAHCGETAKRAINALQTKKLSA